ncbi:low molecular weight phosphotyrosine protein phosphatase [Campylobacter sp. MIT 21-1685]|uniref:low molecular weight protein-tyrosine-phosphatase n=1 Tax=unclassified Campylobacter TaxID=2593542 RepID=UPI00224B4527|nr:MULTISPECIES: low molecular weight protein-tyrosine-phosphatase [unclassified Campylobacter]MCX2682500.1 low molecular weight phosphotyrosine protein phosphatase [Campylobacter sp. MIT 21-1684]MCX2750787.1 low molecular weight phosphotyrosine protein phosphatase [Campylobacter sp. MIT 21-1682]MCX2806981.1 low molecular weight phosphotyrosine protein phosphatase [Campylobacter sp. MIT 21-1685]
MRKILFVCLGNICRSPMAEFVMRDLLIKAKLQDKFEVLSAGTSGEHNGEQMHYGTKKILNAHNIPSTPFRSQKLTQKLCDEANYILTMDNSNFNNVMKTFNNIQNKIIKFGSFTKELHYNEVPDPWYSGDFDESYTIISHGCVKLLEKIQKEL